MWMSTKVTCLTPIYISVVYVQNMPQCGLYYKQFAVVSDEEYDKIVIAQMQHVSMISFPI